MIGKSAKAAALLEIPISIWPAGDRAAWERSQVRVRGPFRRENGGRQMSRRTLQSRIQAYGRWLAHLRDSGQLEETAAPSSRITPDRLDAFIQDMRSRGNRPATVIGRIYNLLGALKMLEPGGDHSWIGRPQGVAIGNYFDVEPREHVVHHSATLLAWAEQLFAEGLAPHKPYCRRALVRDAAIIGVFVMPAPRVGALSQLRLGRNLQRRDEGWWLDQDAGITKTSKAEWCPLAKAVTPIIDRYLAVERVELLKGRLTDHLWIGRGGDDLTESSVRGEIYRRSECCFDQSFGPHAFRRSLSTTVAVATSLRSMHAFYWAT